MCNKCEVYELTYTNRGDYYERRERYGFYFSKEKAEKIMNKIQRIKDLAEELDRSFKDYDLDELVNDFVEFEVDRVYVQ